MAAVAKRYQDELKDIKSNVEEAYTYFQPNFDTYHKVRRFVFKSNIGTDEKAKLNQLKKPPLEFNVLEAYISRLRGEFSKQEPSFEVHAEADSKEVNPQLINTLEGHMRAILEASKRESVAYNVYTDLLSGGFSVMKVSTEYENERSFNQRIKLSRVYDPTLTGFDPLARLPHKSDGAYCFELYPKTKEDLLEEFDGIDLSQIQFAGSQQGFNWSYRSGKNKIALVCNYYAKKKKRMKILQLSDESVVTPEDYEKLKEQYAREMRFEQPPVVVNDRMADTEIICRYIFIENQVLEYTETDFKYLPLIFVDGNSLLLRDGESDGTAMQFTRPYVVNAVDSQRLKNLAGQTLANEIENMVAHKWKVAKEAIPPQYASAYTDTQVPNVLVYNAFKEDGQTQIPPPMEVMRVPIPPEVPNTFMTMDQTIQAQLGSYDAALGINNNQLSGVAIVEGATQSNAAAMPYVVNYLTALGQAACIILDLIPKYYVNPRTIPIIDKQGKKVYSRVNDAKDPQSVNLKYQSTDLGVTVEAGVNFEIQKNQTLQVLGMLAQSFPAVQALINQKGLPIIFDNLSIRGADQLKSLAEEFMQEMQHQQQQQQQSQGQMPNPLVIKQQELGLKAQQLQQQNAHKAADIQLDQMKLENERLRDQLQFVSEEKDRMVQLEKANTEREVHAANIALDMHDQLHQHTKDAVSHAKDSVQMIHGMQMDHERNNNSANSET